MGLNDLSRQIVAILRYIAAPAVGLIVVWLVDNNHKVVKVAAKTAWPWTEPPSLWLLAGVLALTGVAVYFAHRIIIHPYVTKVLVWHHTRGLNPKPTVDDLAFARWERRGAAGHNGKQSAQSVLDETNAAVHFFYCSAWSSLLIALALKVAFSNDFCLAGRRLALIVTVLFLIAIVGDWRTARLDLKAYQRYTS